MDDLKLKQMITIKKDCTGYIDCENRFVTHEKYGMAILISESTEKEGFVNIILRSGKTIAVDPKELDWGVKPKFSEE